MNQIVGIWISVFRGGYAYRPESDRIVLYRAGAKSFDFIGGPSSQSSPTVPPVLHTATKLPGGKILIAGGWSQPCDPFCANGIITVFDTAESLRSGYRNLYAHAGKMGTPRYGHTGTLVCSPAT